MRVEGKSVRKWLKVTIYNGVELANATVRGIDHHSSFAMRIASNFLSFSPKLFIDSRFCFLKYNILPQNPKYGDPYKY